MVLQFGHDIAYAGSFKNQKNAFLNDPKRFLAIFLSLVCWIDLILHILIELNVFQQSATLPGHGGSFKSHKNALLSDPKCEKGGFLDLGLMDRLDIAYYDRTICFPTLGNTSRS